MRTFDPFLFREIFREADTGQFRVGVNDAGDDVVVHVPGFARDQFDAGDAFLLGFVRQHRTGDDVADRVNAGDVGPKHLVHFDPATLVERDADFVRADSFGKRAATDGDEHFVGFEVQFFAAFGGGGDGAAVADFDRANLGLEMKLHALRGEGALEKIRDFEIEAEGDPREKFEHRHFGAESAPDRTELEADRAGADDEKFLRRFLETKRFGAADNRFAVERHARQVDRHAAGRDHDVVGCDFGRARRR